MATGVHISVLWCAACFVLFYAVPVMCSAMLCYAAEAVVWLSTCKAGSAAECKESMQILAVF